MEQGHDGMGVTISIEIWSMQPTTRPWPVQRSGPVPLVMTQDPEIVSVTIRKGIMLLTRRIRPERTISRPNGRILHQDDGLPA